VILGCSPDSVEKERKFKEKYALSFTLLADPTHAVAESYDVWKLKSFLGKSYHGVERSTYLIDPAGRIAHTFEKVKAEGHAEAVRAKLVQLR
jgi:thioredoxin-dependent peroxiredoxin